MVDDLGEGQVEGRDLFERLVVESGKDVDPDVERQDGEDMVSNEIMVGLLLEWELWLDEMGRW